MKLYFNDNFDTNTLIANVDSEEKALSEINKYLKKHKYVSSYMRTWTGKRGKQWFDFGSHTEFFVLDKN